MQAKQDNTRDHSNYFFILKCMGALAASSALIACVYWLTKAAPLADITAKTLFTFAATTTSLPAVLALVGIVALFCAIPFAVGGSNNYYPQAHVHNGYTGGYSFWRPSAVNAGRGPVVLGHGSAGAGPVIHGHGSAGTGPVIHGHGSAGTGPVIHGHGSAGTGPLVHGHSHSSEGGHSAGMGMGRSNRHH